MASRIAVLMAIDEPYAAPFCVTVTSLLAHLRPGVGLDLYVMGHGLADATRRTLAGTFDERVRLHWVALDAPKVARLRGYGYMASPAANFRLVAGSSLPSALTKVIYLDADLLVRGDLVELWERDMGGHIVLAVQDSYIQRLPRYCRPASAEPSAPQPYFNSGVMVIDLAAWRAAGVEDACCSAAERLRHRSKWLDQDALNAALVGRWGALAPAWNKQFWLDLVPDWGCSPHDEAEFAMARRAPAIIHFCTQTKPWHAVCDHRTEDVRAYRAVLDATVFGDAATVAPSPLRRSVECFAAPHRRLRDTIAAAVRAKHRGHALAVMLPGIVTFALCRPWTLVTVPLAVAGERLVLRFAKSRAVR